MRLREYIAHRVIGTPMERTAVALRNLGSLPWRLRHPELRRVFEESERIERMMDRVIAESVNCIDVGSHLGSVLNRMQRLAPGGRHIAVEPIPYKAAWLRSKFPRVEVLELALSDREGEEDFCLIPHHSGYSGLRFHDVSGESPTHMPVKCARLDDVVPPDRDVGFIKIDVEGGELGALRGAVRLLGRCRPVVLFECTQSGLKAYQITAQDMHEFFAGEGYAVWLVEDWLDQRQPLSVDGFATAMRYPFQAFNFLAVPETAAARRTEPASRTVAR